MLQAGIALRICVKQSSSLYIKNAIYFENVHSTKESGIMQNQSVAVTVVVVFLVCCLFGNALARNGAEAANSRQKAIVANSACPPDFDPWNGNCYKTLTGGTYDQYQATCRDLNGSIVNIKDTDIADALRGNPNFAIKTFNGLRFNTDGSASWSDGSAFDNSLYSDFNSKNSIDGNTSPLCFLTSIACSDIGDYVDSIEAPVCVTFVQSADHAADAYNVASCDSTKYAALCQHAPKADDTSTTITATTAATNEVAPNAKTTNSTCSSGFTGVHGRCFKRLSGSQTQGQGASSCQALDAEMYRFNDDPKTLVDVMTAFKIFPSTTTNIPFWVDASPSGDMWVYPDNTTVPRNPQPKHVRPVTNCIIAVANGINNSFGWTHATCSNKYGIVCEHL